MELFESGRTAIYLYSALNPIPFSVSQTAREWAESSSGILELDYSEYGIDSGSLIYRLQVPPVHL